MQIAGENPSKFSGDDRPVENVNWNDAVSFCEKLTKLLPEGLKATLPTEAQWEYACRAGTTTPYWFGEELKEDLLNCWFGEELEDDSLNCLGHETTPVK